MSFTWEEGVDRVAGVSHEESREQMRARKDE